MTQYVLRRLLLGVVQLFLFVTLVFFLVQLLLPGDFVSQFALSFSPQQAADLRTKLGLDLPLWQQYLRWLLSLAQGDLGQAYTRSGEIYPVAPAIMSLLPYTIMLLGFGTALAFLVGQSIGKFVAWRGRGFLSSAATFLGIILYTSFPPWLAFLATYTFRETLGFFAKYLNDPLWHTAPVSQVQVLSEILWLFTGLSLSLLCISILLRQLFRVTLPPPLFFILLVAAWVATFFFYEYSFYVWEILKALALPFVVYLLLSFGEILFVMRTSMMDLLHEDFITTARAKGLSGATVRDKHAARNAWLPVLSRLVMRLPYLLTAAAMLEWILQWWGMGSSLLGAVLTQNTPMILGLILIIGVISLVARLGLDILLAYLDPRIRLTAETIGSPA